MSEPLFDGYEPMPLPKSREPGLSADQRRTLRQTEAIRKGVHPLTGHTLHEFADRYARKTDAKGLPFTCGSCIFRQPGQAHGRTYPKCTFTGALGADQIRYFSDLPRVSHGAATDVRAWWPACPDYSPGDTGLSRDAARSIPPTEGDTA